MADAGTLATTAQVLLSIGQDGSTEQILEANTNIWILYAESEMEQAAGNGVEIVANYASITASYKQWLAIVAANRAAFFAPALPMAIVATGIPPGICTVE